MLRARLGVGELDGFRGREAQRVGHG
jgi:hypothetical protein